MADRLKDGTLVSGLVSSEENKPPRECWNCKWYDKPLTCDHPVVMADPEALKHADGTVAVERDWCCDNFQNKRVR